MNQNGRRRRFTAKEKLAILEEGRQTGASISEVCRRHGASTGQYYQWKKLAREAHAGRRDAESWLCPYFPRYLSRPGSGSSGTLSKTGAEKRDREANLSHDLRVEENEEA